MHTRKQSKPQVDLMRIALVAVLMFTGLFVLSGCGEDEERNPSISDEVVVCDVPPCSVGAGGGGGGGGNGGGGGGGGSTGSGVGGDTDTTGGSGDDQLLSLTNVVTSEDSVSLMLVMGTPACIPGQECLVTFTATNETDEFQSLVLALSGSEEYADTVELFSDCSRVIAPRDTCQASVTFVGMPPDPGPTKRVCLGNLAFFYNERRISGLSVCAQSDFDACRVNPCR